MDTEETTEIDPLSETCSSSISRKDQDVDEHVLELREEDEEKQSLNEVRQLLCT